MSWRSCSSADQHATLSRCPISGPSIGGSAPAHTIRHRRSRIQMGLTLLLLRRAGEQLVKDVECPLHFGLPDDPRLLQEIRLCKGGKKNALRWEVTPAGVRLLITLPVRSPQHHPTRPLLCSLPVPSLKGPMARIYYWPLTTLRWVGRLDCAEFFMGDASSPSSLSPSLSLSSL